MADSTDHSDTNGTNGGTRGSGSTGTARLQQFGYHQELKRSLSFRDLLIYGLVFMVPIAPFGIFGSVYEASGGMVALAYCIGAVGMMAGSVYTYAGRGLAQPGRLRRRLGDPARLHSRLSRHSATQKWPRHSRAAHCHAGNDVEERRDER